MSEYIERDAVLAKSVPVPGFFCNMISSLDVLKLPAANVEMVRYGTWIPVDEKEDAFDCSECDAMVRMRHNFCPECGANMNATMSKEPYENC